MNNNVLDGGAGKDVLQPFGGWDSLIGGANADTFWFEHTVDDGVKTIHDFTPGGADHDFIRLEDYVGVNDFASLKNHMTDSGGGVVIDLGATQITLLNVLMKDLSAIDFLFY